MNKSPIFVTRRTAYLLFLHTYETTTRRRRSRQRMAGQPATRISIWRLHRLVGRDGVQDEKRR